MWNRQGTFENRLCDTKIHYKNSAPTATIRKIILDFGDEYEVDDKFEGMPRDSEFHAIYHLELWTSALHLEEVNSKCTELFADHHIIYGPRLFFIKIRIKSIKKDFQLLEQLFNYFNTKYARVEFTRDLITDLRSVFNRTSLNKGLHIRAIPEPVLITERVNPDRKNSQQLVKIIEKNFSFDKFAQALVEGEDPNQHNFLGHTVLYILVNHELIKFLEKIIDPEVANKIYEETIFLLLRYGARFFECVNGFQYYESPFELAYKYKDTSKKSQICLNLMSNEINYLAKLVKQPQFPVKYYDSYIDSKGTPTTQFNFYRNITIITRLTKDELDPKIKEIIWNLFRITYKSPTGNEIHVREIFDEVINPENNRLIELIYAKTPGNDEKLIGFNLFEILMIGKDHLISHAVFTGLEEEYGHLNLMPTLILRFGFSLQLLYPDFKIGVNYSPMVMNVYRMMGVNTDLEHIPMQQPDDAPVIVDKMLNAVYKDSKYSVYHKAMTWCIEEEHPLIVANPRFKVDANDPNQIFFNKYIMKKSMYPIVYWPVAHKSFTNFHRMTYALGIGSLNFINQQATLIEPFIKNLTGVETSKPLQRQAQLETFCDSVHLFWKNKRKPLVPKNKIEDYPEPPLRSALG